jgi:hypothetical protein
MFVNSKHFYAQFGLFCEQAVSHQGKWDELACSGIATS